MKYDIIAELENNVFIDEKSVIKLLTPQQIKDLRYILSGLQFKPGSVHIISSNQTSANGRIDYYDDEIDYEAKLKNDKESYFSIKCDICEDKIISIFRFLKNAEEFKLYKIVSGGLLVVECFEELFKPGFTSESKILVKVKYYDKDALALLRVNCLSDKMEDDLKKKGIIPDEEGIFEITREELIKFARNLFEDSLNTYKVFEEYVKSNKIIDLEEKNKKIK